MKLRLQLQRSQDETQLARNDLDRRKNTVKELEDSMKFLSKDFQDQQQRCKELEELLVIRESEVSLFRVFKLVVKMFIIVLCGWDRFKSIDI